MAEATEATEAPDDHAQRQPPRSDFRDAVGWTILGFAILVGSLRMDRLESQNINPYTVPGLLPGLLGLTMFLLGGVMALRSWRRGAFTQPAVPASGLLREERRRAWLVIGLCVGYGVVLVGHGIPFWLASSIYVTGSVLILRRLSRDEDERRLDGRAWLKALVIGVGASVVTQLVFQELFLVRMP
ncbi:tripartite tricarboxylate transporter TctB family protein [Caenimonas terrae]|uniref:Tripartite tricarboxylate transporter TctB family protein n=1 Tax=Caenimonas terrae TaxID=696074 RepID=A0ABW0NEZ0_9BURK